MSLPGPHSTQDLRHILDTLQVRLHRVGSRLVFGAYEACHCIMSGVDDRDRRGWAKQPFAHERLAQCRSSVVQDTEERQSFLALVRVYRGVALVVENL